MGICAASHRPISFNRPVASGPSTACAKLSLPKKKKPAMTMTGAKILMANRKPSRKWSVAVSSASFNPWSAMVMTDIKISAVPATNAVASPPEMPKRTMKVTSSKKAVGIRIATTMASRGRATLRVVSVDAAAAKEGVCFSSRRIIQNATPNVVTHMTTHNGTLAFMTATVSTPAAVAVISGAPWIKKSDERPAPCPNRFMATAAQSAGRPTRDATGSKRAPMSATAGLGQISQDIINMAKPMTQNAVLRVRMMRPTGRINIWSAPTAIMA